ncbi:MAG: hypothetical protein OXC03_11165 [Flavobacteriaceae bacterium]|nr:hypothetical protein [Flavobacteriaceae bacterium]
MFNLEPGDLMVLGSQLENPYSVENMEKALAGLRKSSRYNQFEDYRVTTTHYYLKYTPESEEHLDILSRDKNLILYGYPLDREIIVQGNYYIDTEVPEGRPMPLYLSVEADYDFPRDVPYEVLSDLHIPSSDGDYEIVQSNHRGYKNFISSLVDESLRLTGNWEEEIQPSPNGRGYWRPSGRIQTYDSSNGSVGVQGLIVRARRWFTTHSGQTDSNGRFSCNGTFKRPANYSFDFAVYDFKVRNARLLFNTAGVSIPKKEGSWYLTLTGKKDTYHATIFQAAYHYYYRDIKGLSAPPGNSALRTQIKLKALQQLSQNAGNFSSVRDFLGIGSTIRIKLYGAESMIVYATTIHELAHAAHWNMGRADYRNISDIVRESWARGVQWVLTNMVYSNYTPWYRLGKYTGVVQDMIDGGHDQVTGYTISQLERALDGQRTWTGWRDNIKKKYNNPTESKLDALFDHWD